MTSYNASSSTIPSNFNWTVLTHNYIRVMRLMDSDFSNVQWLPGIFDNNRFDVWGDNIEDRLLDTPLGRVFR